MIYEIPMIPGHVPPVIHISQGDIGREVVLQVTGDTRPPAAQARIRGIRPDGAAVTQTVTYGTGTSVGRIVWLVNGLFAEIEGDVVCEIFLDYSTENIGTQNFILRVEGGAYKPDAPEPWSSVTITEPGTYNVRPYGEVIVDMEAGPQPEGTIEITTNGTHDVAAYAAASVNVSQREEPSGTRTITVNGDYDVSDYAEAHVEVEGGAQPSGTAEITENGTHDISEYAYVDVDVQPEGLTMITTNGRHNVADFAEAEVDVQPTGTTTILTNGFHDVSSAAIAEVDVPSGVNWCVTPEDYGAVGDGETDDTAAFRSAVMSGKTVVCAGKYLIDGISAPDVDIMMMQGAKIIRNSAGNDPFICVNTQEPAGGYITKKSYIRGGAIDAGEAEIAIAVNRAEQFTLEQIEIGQCHTGLYLGYATEGNTAYNIESRVDKVKFVNKLGQVADPSAYVDSVAVMDMRTDSQYSNVIIENFHLGFRVGGNAEINNSHHWISREEIFDGSVTFRVDENIRAFFTDCCSDSVETGFYVYPYSGVMVKGFSQVRSNLMPTKTRMNYLVADEATETEKTLWFFSYASAHRGHPSVGSVFYEVSDNVYARYESLGATYDSHLVIEGAAVSNMAAEGGQNNLIPYGYRALGALKNFMGLSPSNLYSFDFNDVLENGCYTVQMATSQNGPDGITSGISNMIVSGHSTGKMQLLVNNTQGIFYRFYNGSWQPWRVLSDVIRDAVPAIRNFSGLSSYTWLTQCDLNSVTTPGFYGIQTSTASNLPTGVTSGTLSLWVGGTNNETAKIMSLIQLALTPTAIYMRARRQITSGWTWTAWEQVGWTKTAIISIVQEAITNGQITI
ncbi:MAG: hypothetical protein IJ126_08180 [Lachnospiraceae bacterium]|nr:hypothetical protein [Lachnospiraceae bacterium]